MSIRVALVEDDPELAEQLSALINASPGFSCALTASSGEAALLKIQANPPDVVLLDIHLPKMDGIQTLKGLKRINPDIIVLMLTVSRDNKALFDSLKAGASGYLLKRTPAEKLLEAIREVHEGGAPMSAQIARQVVQFFRSGEDKLAALTSREHQVLQLLGEGRLYKEIACELNVSINTVRTYIRIIYEKLHVNSRAEASRKLFGCP
jgi:DNA-binding NarL/FixJ family response regulator